MVTASMVPITYGTDYILRLKNEIVKYDISIPKPWCVCLYRLSEIENCPNPLKLNLEQKDQAVIKIHLKVVKNTLNPSNASDVVALSGNHPAVIAIDNVPGRVVVIGDANLFDNRGFEHQDNRLFALNVFRWLIHIN